MAYNLKSIREDFRARGVFYTDDELANLIRQQLELEYAASHKATKVPFYEVYDPTCGDGALLSVYPDSVNKYGQELDGNQLDVAKERLVNFRGVQGDTLEFDGFEGRLFESIAANPPFSIKWKPENHANDPRFYDYPLAPQSKADYAFILHCLAHLCPEGTAAILCFPGILYRGNREKMIRELLVERGFIKRIIRIPKNHFVDTKIEVVLLILKRERAQRCIEFADYEDMEHSRIVELDEIRANAYDLQPFVYLKKDTIQPEVDEQALNDNARNLTVLHLRSQIEYEKTICDLTGGDFKAFLLKLKSVIEEFL